MAGVRNPQRLSDPNVAQLARSIRGDIVVPSDPGYDDARAVWNGMIDRTPALIVRCAGDDDVASTIGFARSNGLQIAVRGGGHGIAGKAVCDGGVVIDLSAMKEVEVDIRRGVVRAGAGALLGDLDRATQAFGLAVPAGTVSETGIAGLTLGGGMGWLSRKHGLTCDNLTAVRMVTADGAVIHANDSSHPDLMWGLRGGGGNFGVVTEFEYQAHAVGPTVLAGFVLHPIDRAEEFLRFYAEFSAGAPDELGTIGVSRNMDPIASVPTEFHGTPIIGTGVCWIGDTDHGHEVLKPLRSHGKPLLDTIGPTSFVEFQASLDAGAPPGLHYYEKSENLPPLTGDLVEILSKHGRQMAAPNAFVGLFQLGGKVSRVAEESAAYTQRNAAFSLVISAGWDDPDDSERHTNWVRSFWRDVQPFSPGGGYINFMSHDDRSERLETAYGKAKYTRLRKLKAEYDRSNVFSPNQNITPAIAGEPIRPLSARSSNPN